MDAGPVLNGLWLQAEFHLPMHVNLSDERFGAWVPTASANHWGRMELGKCLLLLS